MKAKDSKAHLASMSERVFVIVDGGVVSNVDVPTKTDGTYTVIDWDNIESDPLQEWAKFDEEDREYIAGNFPDEFAQYFEPLGG